VLLCNAELLPHHDAFLRFGRWKWYWLPLPFTDFSMPNLSSRLFEPIWDVKIMSCKHAYHAFCALSHLSIFTMCLFEGYGWEMHPLWWAQEGIKKMGIVEKVGPRMDWRITTPTLGNFDWVFLYPLIIYVVIVSFIDVQFYNICVLRLRICIIQTLWEIISVETTLPYN
jgi:hypothetical protein